MEVYGGRYRNPVSLEGGRFISKNEMLFSTDFLGEYEAGETVGEDEFQMSVPDKDCDYLDLQIYDKKIVREDYGWEPVRKPFRILITH